MHIKLLTTIILLVTPCLQLQAGWNPASEEKTGSENVNTTKVAEALANFKKADPGLNIYFSKAFGYAIFPTVGKGAIGIGGAYGSGEVFKKGRLIGKTSISQLTIGFQLGGQAYSELIFFKDKNTLDNFTSGNFEFGAQASAVAVTAGASADADYDNGVAIFTMAKGGLMYEASVGGQKFSFTPVK